MAWCALESLALHARPDGAGRLVAPLSARELAGLLGVGRDAATRALGALRRSGLVATEERRASGGRFARSGLVIVLPVNEDGSTAAAGRRHSPRHAPEPTLFDPPTASANNQPDREPSTIDHTNQEHQPNTNEDRPPDTRPQPTDHTTHPNRAHTRLPGNSHTLALRMPTACDAGGARC